MDATKNFAISAVATAPSPAVSGTSLVVTTGQGARFAAVPFNAVVCPANAQPTPANAEVVRVTARATDTLTIARAQEGSTARTVVVGDQIYAGPTALLLGQLFSDYDARMAAEGLLAQTGPRETVVNVTGTGTGTVRMCLMYLRAGMVLTTAWIGVGANGTGITLCKVGIWNTAGTLQRATSDFSSAINTGTVPRGQSGALTSQWTVPADGAYWVGILQVGTTPATVACIGQNSGGSWALGSNPHPCPALSAQTDCVTFAPASLVGSGTIPWIGFT